MTVGQRAVSAAATCHEAQQKDFTERRLMLYPRASRSAHTATVAQSNFVLDATPTARALHMLAQLMCEPAARVAAHEYYPPLARWPLTIRERGAEEDREAAAQLGAIFRTNYGELFDLVVHYVDSRALAEEIIQDTFLAVWKRRHAWGPEMDVKGYVFQTARHRALNHLRRARIELNWQQLLAARRDEWGMSQYTSDARVMADVDEVIEEMRRAVSALPKRIRRTIILRLQWNLTNAEIAEVMGIGLSAVEKNISRALKALRKALGERP